MFVLKSFLNKIREIYHMYLLSLVGLRLSALYSYTRNIRVSSIG